MVVAAVKIENGKISASYTSDRGLIFRIYKALETLPVGECP